MPKIAIVTARAKHSLNPKIQGQTMKKSSAKSHQVSSKAQLDLQLEQVCVVEITSN